MKFLTGWMAVLVVGGLAVLAEVFPPGRKWLWALATLAAAWATWEAFKD
jgi:hypothetical protein